MAFSRRITASGQFNSTVKEGLVVNVSFDYTTGNAPVRASWNFADGNTYASGEYNISESIMQNYNVNNGIIDDEILKELSTFLSRIKEEYETI